MSAKIQQALELVKKNKHKKALAILKKINQKKQNQSFLSLHLEGVCLAQSKQYALAEIQLNIAHSLALTPVEEIDVLTNLYKVAIAQNKQLAACAFIKKLFFIDSPNNAVLHIKNICSLSFDAGEYKITIEFAEKLSTSPNEEDKTLGIIYLFLAFTAIADAEKSEQYYTQLLPYLIDLEKETILFIVYNLKNSSHSNLINPILDKVAFKFQHQSWYKETISYLLNKTLTDKKRSQHTPQNIPSSLVVSQNIEIKSIIERLLERLMAMGSQFHKDLRFIENNGELSIHSYANPDKAELLMQVPVHCMPLISDYDFSLNGNSIVAKVNKNIINSAAEPIMKLMIELYNKTNKIEHWRNTQPLLILQDSPELLEVLFEFRPMGEKITKFKKLFEQKNWNELLISSFLGSREFVYKKEFLARAGIKTQQTSEKGLLSVIDFLNHKMGNSFYLTDKKQGLVAICAKPDKETKEVFVQYAVLDPILAYLTYGFIDKVAPILFSGRLSFKTLTGLNFNIISVSAILESNNNDSKNAHLEYYLPAGIERKGDCIYVSDIIIPSNNGKSTLDQVLAVIIKQCDDKNTYQDNVILEKEITHIKREIITGNYNFWQKFEQLIKLELSKGNYIQNNKQALLDLCHICQQHIIRYAKTQNISVN